jgi:hypothetical protein
MEKDTIDNTDEDFNKMKNSIIYFDWNILSYLLGTTELVNDIKSKIFCLSTVIDNFLDKEKCCFPYSDFHFRDILLGTTYTEEKIDFLYSFTKGWYVTESPNNKELVQYFKHNDIHERFALYKKTDVSNKAPLSLPINEINDILYKMGKNKDLEKIKNAIGDMLLDNTISSGLSILRINKKLKNTAIKINNVAVKYPNVNKDKIFNEVDIHQVVDNALRNSNIIFPDKLIEAIFALAKPKLSDFTIQILKLYYLCDFIGLTSENVKKETSFESMINDVSHLSLALRLPFFVTEDKNLRMKAMFIKKWFSLPVKIFDIDSFIQTGLAQIYKQEGQKCIINFSNNDKIVRTYEV